MGRNIVLCLDGTNNQYAATNTNVVKLYGMLDRLAGDQIAYYQPGIGTYAPPGVMDKAKRWWMTRLDLAIAWLLSEHVTEAYRFLMRYYQHGDQIFIFGFSRGAYTARALAAMLYKVGLLTAGNEELLPFAWNMFKRERDVKVYKGFRHTFSRFVPIHFLGVWDTVSSVGWAWHPRYLQFTAENPVVKVVRHAISLDERRTYFVQNLWTNDPPQGQDVLQVWFPGVHCDVGGGYKEKEAGLSKIALKWMVDQAEAYGLRIQPKAKEAILPENDTTDYAAPKPAAMKHESLRGLWWLAEYLPKRVKVPSAGYSSRWIIPGGRSRFVIEGAKIHTSVFERMEALTDYRPRNLPTSYIKVP